MWPDIPGLIGKSASLVTINVSRDKELPIAYSLGAPLQIMHLSSSVVQDSLSMLVSIAISFLFRVSSAPVLQSPELQREYMTSRDFLRDRGLGMDSKPMSVTDRSSGTS